MDTAHDTAVPSRSRRARVALPALLLIAALTVSACATPRPGAAASPTFSPSSATASPTATPAPTPASTETPTSEPTPSDTATADAPYNGEILVVTSEVRSGALEVTAMVPGVSESGGTCTLTRDDTEESVSVEATEGKGVTYCGLMSIPVASDAGEVAFHVDYFSPQLRAKSATATVEPGQ